MSKLRLMTIVGTRPEIIKLSETIKKCDKYFEHILVHTGQNYDYTLNEVFFEELGIREPDYYLNVVGDNLGQTMGNVISKSYDLMNNLKPDAILVLGDTNSCLSVISAKRLKIPIFHMEAGNRCFDENLPEEINRRIVDHTSDVNLCYTEHARRYLNNEGVNRERTYVVGSPMAEVFKSNIEKINESNVIERLGLESKKYIILSAHREENIDNEKNFFELMNAINALAEIYDMPVIYSMHPRSKRFISERDFKFHPNVRTLQPFGFSDYNKLQKNSFCVVSDSGTVAEEASYFKFPAVSIRTSTERPEAIDKGNFIVGSITAEQVLQAVEIVTQMNINNEFGVNVPDYIDENVSTKIVKIIQSYTSLVNRMVWRKQ
ncbi:non-hydrolyzing UDP-N-acetylglucosamine 2-epimerase [Clostridium sp.]|uniref:non-hydrolyzing UDP-N-acetylglucosamine 2-epimerase n=1 Tax=Clostridium sp. TaxID=1506 RepID=UPI00290EBF88|nr:UDP-N-acetylglucosamine 2-epimerase (non-hydrolyzing) [Clostridium sp.]MDU5106515.1 UDP-N-acetylglucosamine 2-epimerase (non-hydrolyzing) [Clostridium sp.]